LWQRSQDDGNVSRCYSTGRPRVTTPNEDRYLAVTAKRNRRSTASDLSRQLSSATGTTVSRQTVYRRLGHIGLYARRPVRCVPLIATHCRLRLAWSREHALWTPQQWSCVMFSNESMFSLQSDSRRNFIWRAPGTRYHQENTIERHRYGGAGWLREYLGQLIQRNRDKNCVGEPRLGEIVLVGDDTKKRLLWPLAKIIELIRGKDGKVDSLRFQQFKTNKSTLVFIVNPLNTNTNEINIEPFGIDAGSLQMQLLDLKTKELWLVVSCFLAQEPAKDLWSGKFTELKSKLEVQKCMHIAQHKWTALKEIQRVEALIFGAWNSLPECYSEVKKMAYGVLTIFGSTYSCEQAFSCMNISKSKVRSQLTNKNLESCLKLKTTNYKPDLIKLSKGMQSQCSH
ncbi:hypothetical protein AVEN_196681-1, partial [Araneus ventricosus]